MKCPDCGRDNIAGDDHCAGCGHDLPAPARGVASAELARRIAEGTVADLGPHPAVTMPAVATVAEAVDLMREERVGCVLVTQKGRVVGILSERDILHKVAGLSDPKTTKVGEVMHADPETLSPDEPVSHAFHHMAVGGYRHMPVTQEDGGVQMVSSR
ncbi:MAG: CBS domain-containing protein, partial [Elusimicrobia bacterium]|nr:CBS domain-containing protein [Elusimicrobiota bacterium]